MFKNKDKKAFDVLLKKMLIVNKYKFEICYFDNENLGPVQSGKIALQQGWYVKTHNEKISGVVINKPLYETYMEALNSVNQ